MWACSSLGIEAPEELRSLARNGMRKIAVRWLKARGPRMDAVSYLLDAMRLFRDKSLQEIQEITLDIDVVCRSEEDNVLIKMAEQEYGPQHPITKKLGSMHADAQALLQERTGKL